MAPHDNDSDDDDSSSDSEKQQSRLGLFGRIGRNIELAQKGYEQLVHAIIRPPRAKYSASHLGPEEFTFLSQRFRRDDVELECKYTTHPSDNAQANASSRRSSRSDDDSNNKTNDLRQDAEEADDVEKEEDEDVQPQLLKMKASIWTRVGEEEEKKEEDEETTSKKTMVVYLHGNASARVEVLPQLSFLLAQGLFGVCSLDFTGSGQSDGDYVSLGYYERYDLETMLQYLQQTYGNLEIVLWGRSMGASTALMHASHITQRQIHTSSQENNNGEMTGSIKSTTILKGLICDSPFASLPILCEELVEKARSQGLVVPGVIVSVAIAMISRSVRRKAHFDIREISPIDHTPTIEVPALFVVGEDDDFIPPHHSEELIEAYKKGVRTNLFMVPGGHNDPRPEIVFEALRQFLRNELSLEEEKVLTVPPGMEKSHIRHPPWAYKTSPHIFQAHAVSAKPQQPAATEMNPTSVDVPPQSDLTSDQEEQEELGMTKERQDDIQNKIQTMLGQGAQ